MKSQIKRGAVSKGRGKRRETESQSVLLADAKAIKDHIARPREKMPSAREGKLTELV